MNQKTHGTSRRTLLKAGASVAVAQVYAARAKASPGPNETINLALIGCGGEGRAVMQAHMRCKGTRIVAVCDVNSIRKAQAQQLAGGSAVRAYHDYRKLLESKDIDAVIVATNDHWHVLPTIHACQAGKDVYVEKPLGTSIGEGRAAVMAARKYNRVVHIGTQQRNWPHYQKAVEIIRSGKLGEISEVKVWDYDYMYPGPGNPPDCDPPPELDWDFWLGPSPKVPYNPNRTKYWYWFRDYAGGWQLDWGVHHYDIVHWAMGVTSPIRATALGGFMCYEETNQEWPDTFSGILEYPPGPVAKKGFILQYSFRGGCRREKRSHAKCFFGTEASLFIDRSGYTITAEARGGHQLGDVLEEERNIWPNDTHINSLKAHAEVFLECIRSRKQSPSDVLNGHYASLPGHLLNISYLTGRVIRWDPVNERVVDDPEANALVTKKYRAPWKLEV